MTTYTKLQQKEWERATKRSLDRFITTALKDRPTRKSVSSKMYNDNPISLLEWLGVALLLAIAVVTGYKMVAIAFPFAASFYPEGTHEMVVSSFGVAMAVVFVLFSTSGLIYYKLMDEYDPEIQKQKKKHSSLEFWGIIPVNLLQYVSPRLYGWLTYLTVAWLMYVSSAGEGSPFEQYLVVLAEVALAYLVANLLNKRKEWRSTVSIAYSEQAGVYDDQLENYQTDKRYLQILYRELRETLTYLERKRDKKRVKPNIGMETAEGTAVDTIIMSEYKRMTGGQRFANAMSKQESIMLEATSVKPDAKRLPPRGDKHWTVDALLQDFIVRGKKKTDQYTEKILAEDYAPNHKARAAWRAGAKEYFA